MNSLKVLILSTILRHGEQSDVSLWNHCRLQLLTAIVIATSELERDGYIEKVPADRPVITCWQLTKQGRQYIAGNKAQQQEVCLGSSS
jgi:hypothetical protein